MRALLSSSLLGAALLSSCSLYGAHSRELDFAPTSMDAPGAGLRVYAGTWSVQSSDDPDHGFVFAQTAARAEDEFNLAVLDELSIKDSDTRVAWRAVDGRIDQGGGIAWRVRDEKNYFLARANPLEGNVRVYAVLDGHRSELGGANTALTPGWHELRVWTRGLKIEVFLDGKSLLELESGIFLGAGSVGLWTKSDARTQFDDLRVQEL